ncbi:hypothetical protein F66182_11910 [Fusarium sp. NRRL 66182]|nr:hypothetical protein F66182_11910 [Fusarium sp. NRRL 66182]
MAQQDKVVFLLTFFAMIIATALLICNRVKPLVLKTQPNNKRYESPFEIRALIEAKELPDWGPNRLGELEAKSFPNEHLPRMFGFENAFTTVDKEHAHRFVRKSKDLINISANDWDTIRLVSADVLRRWKEEAQKVREDYDFRIDIQPLVQTVTLCAVLKTFFLMDNDEWLRSVPLEAFTRLAQSINETWMMPKSGNPIVDFKDNGALQDALNEVLPLANILDKRENPLRFILPGFETMWRVVLRGFIEVAFKTGKKHKNWREALVEYSRNTTTKDFNKSYTPDGVSPSHLVKETLRLYPPTKQIYREWKNADSAKSTTIAADIQACHHSTDIWGGGAREFNPLRWQEVTKAQEESFLAFGSKPFECPAKPTFAPRFVGLLIGILLQEFSKDCKLMSETGEMEFGPELLSNDRSGWKDVYLLVPHRLSGM